VAKDFEFRGDLDVKGIRKGFKEIEGDLDRIEARGTQAFTNVGKKGRQEVRQLGFALQRMGIGGVAAFGEIFAALGPIGIAIGAIVISTLALIKVFKTLANIAINTFKTVVSAGVEAAQEMEIAGAQFRAVFRGNAEAAEAALNRVLKLSKEVGQNLVGVSRAFLPEVENLDQLEEILKIAAALAQFQPEQGILGARIALQEFLSGETRSLRRRFEVPQADIDRIKEAFDTRGIGGAIEELNNFLDRTGRSLDDLADTSSVAFNRMREGFRQLAGVFGEPIVDAAKEELDDLNATFNDLEPTLRIIADAAGEVVGQFVDIIGTEIQSFIENIDFNNIIEFIIALQNVAESFGIMIGQLDAGAVAGGGFNGFIAGLTDLLFGLEAQFLNVALSIAETREQLSGFAEVGGKAAGVAEKITDIFGKGVGLSSGGNPALLPARGGLEALEKGLGLTEKIAEGIADTDGKIQDINEAIAESAERRKQFAIDIAAAFANIGQDDTSGEDVANDIRTEDKALLKLLETLGLIAEAEKEAGEAREEFQAKAAEKAIKIETDYQREILDIRIANARRFLDIEEKTLQKFEDLRIEFASRLRDAQTDQERDLEDIARRQARKKLDVEKDLNDDKIDIEKDYLRRLEEIRRRFDFDANEAIRANDAIAFLRIQRRLAFELNEAKINRDEDIEDAKTAAERKRQALQDTNAQEIEDANITNKRKLEDLNKWLGEQTDAINLWNEREHERRLLRWEQERADAALARDQQLEDYNDWWVKNNIATEQGIADNLNLMEGWLREVQIIIDRFPSLSDLVPSSVGSRAGGASGRGARGAQQREQRARSEENRRRREQQELSQLRNLAYHLAIQLGNTPSEVRDAIEGFSLSELREAIQLWQLELRNNSFQQGGFVSAGQTSLVTEPFGAVPNPEVFFPFSGGIDARLENLNSARQGVSQAMDQVFAGATGRKGIFPLDPPVSQLHDPQLLGGSLRSPRPRPTLFRPGVSGYIVPLRNLARKSGRSGDEVASIIDGVIGGSPTSSPADKTMAILSQLGIEGFATGGFVSAGKTVVVGEPLPGGRANPEVFFPGISTLDGDGTARPAANITPTDRGLPGGPRARTPGTRGEPVPEAGRPKPELPGVPGVPTAPSLPFGGGFAVEDLTLRQMFFSPPFISPSGGTTSVDNSRTVEVVNPEINPGLSPLEITQIKEIYSELKLEESLV
jgi:hypothetical protein